MGKNPPMPDWQEKIELRTRSAQRAECACLPLLLLLCLLAGCGGQQPSTPDCAATGAAIEKAARSSLTAHIPTQVVCQPTKSAVGPDVVASGVAMQRAIAATLAAEQEDVPAVTPTAVAPAPTADVIATGVAIQRAIAATLTAEARAGTSSSEPWVSEPSATSSTTPAPTQPSPTPESSMPDCAWWNAANTYIGTHHCICGVVTETYDDPSSTAFFINFSSDHSGYYAVSFNLSFHDLEGKCVRICGMVEIYRDRPQTIIREVEQLEQIGSCP